MGNYKCQRPIHPGELLKEEVGNRKLPQTKLAAESDQTLMERLKQVRKYAALL